MAGKPLKIKLDADLQARNRLWWDQSPMRYDWREAIAAPEGAPEFFEEIDRRFFSASSFYRGERPFARLIPFDSLKGKRVLEIGCGLGSHAQLLCEAGSLVTAVDLTPKAVELTRARLSLKGLAADVRVMDAEQMGFDGEQFDLVWSWGVIHHSANPERILAEARRVLKPLGELRLMVYHRRSLNAYTAMARGILSGKFFRGVSVPDVLSFYTDGFIARYYTRAELSGMLRRAGLSTVSMRVLGQKSELVPLPGKGPSRRLKSALLSRFPNTVAEGILSLLGSFLFAVAAKGE